MGALTYDGITTPFDDRVLAHLQIVIVLRLRNNRSFLMSWLNSLNTGDGRSSIWIHDNASLRFTFNGSRPPAIDTDWLALLGEKADGPQGLIVIDEHGTPIRSSDRPR